jgi:hypothetical protein
MGKENIFGIQEFGQDFMVGAGREVGSSWVLLTKEPERYLDQIKGIIETHLGQTRILLANDLNSFKEILPQLRQTQGWIERGDVQVLVTNEGALIEALRGEGGNVLQHYVSDTYIIRSESEYDLDK